MKRLFAILAICLVGCLVPSVFGALRENPVTTATPANSTNEVRNMVIGKAFDTLTITNVLDRFNVKTYGAVGDEATDDSAAFQAALDAATNSSGGAVYVPPGRYRLGTGITVHPYTVIRGDGLDKSIIMWTNVGVGVTMYYETAMENIGTRGASYWTGVGKDCLPGNIFMRPIEEDYHIWLRQCDFNGFDVAVYLDTAWVIGLQDNMWRHCNTAILATNGGVNAIKISGGEIVSCTNGLLVQGGGASSMIGVSMSHMTIEATHKVVYVDQTKSPKLRNFTMEDVYIENGAGYTNYPQIYLTNVINGLIHKCNFVGSSGSTNIVLAGCQQVHVSDNDFIYTFKSVIQDSVCSGCNITGNHDNYFDVSLVQGKRPIILWDNPSSTNGTFRMPGELRVSNMDGTEFSTTTGFRVETNLLQLLGGTSAGQYASTATRLHAFGFQSGQYATNTDYSVFSGSAAGRFANEASYSVFSGESAGEYATNASHSQFVGQNAGRFGYGASSSRFVGQNSGRYATNSQYSTFLGNSAGEFAGETTYAEFIGHQAGQYSTNGDFSVFLGYSAGQWAGDSTRAVLVGREAGRYATNSDYSLYLGAFAGTSVDRANTLIIDSTSSTRGTNGLIYGEFDNNLVRINGTLESTNNIVAKYGAYFIGLNTSLTNASGQTIAQEIAVSSGDLSNATNHVTLATNELAQALLTGDGNYTGSNTLNSAFASTVQATTFQADELDYSGYTGAQQYQVLIIDAATNAVPGLLDTNSLGETFYVALMASGGVASAELVASTNTGNFITASGNPTVAQLTASTNTGNYITASGNPSLAQLQASTNSGNYITATKVATTGTADGTKFLRDDYSWQAVSGLTLAADRTFVISNQTSEVAVYTNAHTVYSSNLLYLHTYSVMAGPTNRMFKTWDATFWGDLASSNSPTCTNGTTFDLALEWKTNGANKAILYAKGPTNESINCTVKAYEIWETNGVVMAAGGGASYLVSENFEGTGLPAGWTEVAGSPEWDITDNALEGSQSVRLACTTSYEGGYTNFTGQADLWVYFMLRATNFTVGDAICSIRDSGGTQIAKFQATSGSNWDLYHGTVESTPTGTYAESETLHIWLHYVKGTGANGVMSAYVSSTTTKPGSPTITMTNGDSTSDAAQVALLAWNPDSDLLFDKLRIDDAEIGSNPE